MPATYPYCRREVYLLNIPILSGIGEGLKVFFKTRRYVAYTIVFFASAFLIFFMSYLLNAFAANDEIENILINLFVYLGATGTIYFMLGSLFMMLGLEKVWITRRGRGRVTEMKGVAWIAVSFAISVFLSIIAGLEVLMMKGFLRIIKNSSVPIKPIVSVDNGTCILIILLSASK